MSGAGTNFLGRSVIAGGRAARPGFSRPNWTRPEAYGFASGAKRQTTGVSPRVAGGRQGRLREEQGLLWGGFSFALGILAYFSLPEEPSPVAVAGLCLPAAVWALARYRSRGLGLFMILCLWFLAGFSAGTLRTAWVYAPKLDTARTLEVRGTVVERQQARSGPRLIIDVLEAGTGTRMAPPGAQARGGGIPARIRVSVPEASLARAGDPVRFKARLFPPASPVRPGGYDFSFTAYFSGIGATGFSYGLPEILDGSAGSTAGLPLDLGFRRGLADLRQSLAAKIRETLPPGDPAELAVALLVGERSGLSEQAEESLRAAGLAHVLAISGLHMALFAGGAHAALLLLLSLFEPLALRYPLHKIAASAALAAAAVYLALSGASVSTQRAFIMISLVFAGILVARRGVTLYSVALAGILLLLAQPEQLFHPGFQMSFASVICLVAVYGRWSEHRLQKMVQAERASARGFAVRLALTPLVWTGGVLATTAIAGLATGLIGAHHFGRIASYGMAGNLLGMPLVSLIIMPMGVLALVLMPFGLSALPLLAMEKGLSMLLSVAAWTQSLDDGQGTLIPPGALATLCLTAGLFWLLLAKGRWRCGALVLLGSGWALLAWERPADLQLADSGATVAARGADGLLRLSPGRASFAGEMWLQAEGVSPDLLKTRRMPPEQASCDETGCVYLAYAPVRTRGARDWARMGLALFGLGPPVSGQERPPQDLSFPAEGDGAEGSGRETDRILVRPLRIALPKVAGALEQDCRFADVIVTELDVPTTCGAPFVIGGKDRPDLGAMSFWLEAVPDVASGDFLSQSNGLKEGAETVSEDAAGTGPVGGAHGIIAQTEVPLPDAPLRVKTVISSWSAAKTRPPRPWHR